MLCVQGMYTVLRVVYTGWRIFSCACERTGDGVLEVFKVRVTFSYVVDVFVAAYRCMVVLCAQVFRTSASKYERHRRPNMRYQGVNVFPGVSTYFPLFSSLFSTGGSLVSAGWLTRGCV